MLYAEKRLRITIHIYIYICTILRDNVAYECFRVLDYIFTKHKYNALL